MRYFVDVRVGCAALVDKECDSYDPDYPGLHPDTGGVVKYFSYINQESQYKDGDYTDREMKIAYLEKLCDQYNKPRTNTVYEKIEFEEAWQAVKFQSETGNFLAIKPNPKEVFEASCLEDVLKWHERGYQLYRKVEKEINWRDTVSKFGAEFDGDSFLIGTAEFDNDGFIKMCHEVAELTDKPE